MQLSEAEKNFGKLVEMVYSHGVSVDLERDERTVARLIPALPASRVTLGGLTEFLGNLPSLGDDLDSFSRDVRTIRVVPII